MLEQSVISNTFTPTLKQLWLKCVQSLNGEANDYHLENYDWALLKQVQHSCISLMAKIECMTTEFWVHLDCTGQLDTAFAISPHLVLSAYSCWPMCTRLTSAYFVIFTYWKGWYNSIKSYVVINQCLIKHGFCNNGYSFVEIIWKIYHIFSIYLYNMI